MRMGNEEGLWLGVEMRWAWCRILYWQIDVRFDLEVHGMIDLSYKIFTFGFSPKIAKICWMGRSDWYFWYGFWYGVGSAMRFNGVRMRGGRG